MSINVYPYICVCLRLSVKYLAPAAWWPFIRVHQCVSINLCMSMSFCQVSRAGRTVACLSVCPYVCVPVFICLCACIYLSVCLYSSVCLSVYPYTAYMAAIRLSVHPCIRVHPCLLPRPAARWPSACPCTHTHPRARIHTHIRACIHPSTPARPAWWPVRPPGCACARGDPAHPRSDVAYFTTVLCEIEAAVLSPRERQSTQASEAGRSARPTERCRLFYVRAK